MTETRATRSTLEIEPPADPATVLIVDDDRAILDGVGEFLREEGFRVVAAGNGAEALARLRAGLRANVILLDVLMPVMDGWDFRAEQLADPRLRDMPVVVISASGFARDTIGAQLKAHDVFAKPLDLERFLETLRALCRGDDGSGQSSLATGADS
jgi:CheY-like chemotaxis protein